MSFYKKSRVFVTGLWKFIPIMLSISFLIGCGQSTPVLLDTKTAPSTLETISTNTPKSVSITPTTTLPLPTKTTVPTVSDTLSPSPTTTPEAVGLVQWAEWQLNYDGEAAWSPDGKFIVFTDDNMAGQDDWTYLYNVETNQQVWKVNQGAGRLTFRPDGDVIIDTSRFIRFWDVRSGEITGPYLQGNAIQHAAYMPDGSELLVGVSWIRGDDSAESEIGFWDDEHKSLDMFIELQGALTALDVYPLEIDPEGKLLVTVMALMPKPRTGQQVFVWDLASKTIHCDLPGYSSAAFNPIDSSLATIEPNSGKITLFDTSDCQPFQILHEANFVSSFSFSPDGKLLAYAGSPDGVIWIQNVQSGDLLYREEGFPDLIKQLSFSPNGKFLLVLGSINVESKDTVKDVVQIWKINLDTVH